MARGEDFPNRLIKLGLHTSLLELTDASRSSLVSVNDIRSEIQRALADRKFIRKVNGNNTLLRPEKIAIRRMMSRYWDNSSAFSLDLVGAVIRQGSFIEKMHSIDWIHSPAATSTMSRLITKYQRYFGILGAHPKQVAVPTLDIDLAW